MPCAGREGCADSGSYATSQPWLWVTLTAVLWVALMLTVLVIRTCSKRQRRHRFLNKVVRPVLGKMGIKVTWRADDREAPPPARAASVHCVTSSTDLPPAYWAVVFCNNENSTCASLDVSSLPTYDEVVTMTSTTSGEGVARMCTSQSQDSDTSQTIDVTPVVNTSVS